MRPPSRPAAARTVLGAVITLVLTLTGCTGRTSGNGHHRRGGSPVAHAARHPTGSAAFSPLPTHRIDTYLDTSGEPRVAISTDPATRSSTWTIQISGITLVGTTQLPVAGTGGTITLSTTMPVRVLTTATTANLTVTGWLRPATLTAHLTLQLDQPPTQAVLDTGTPDIAAARSTVATIVNALRTSDWTTIANLLAPDVTGGAPPSTIAASFAATGITHVTITLVGAGHLTRLRTGNPAWIQDYNATARTKTGTQQRQHGSLILIDENGQWWLLTAGPP